ncbi:MAG: hypothetical protein KJ601_01060 [Nanoarchaeota archaeon]|nr:hypothetical protein [Nanoarchaeota archaeon]
MQKRGVSIAFNTIIIAAIALVVLIVLWIIFTGGIKKGAGGIGNVEGESIAQVNDVSWCLPTTMTGGGCEIDKTDGCHKAKIEKTTDSCKLVCDKNQQTQQKHKVLKTEAASSVDCKLTEVPGHFYCCT